MYPSEGDVTWRGSFVKEQVEAVKSIDFEDQLDLSVFHIKGPISNGTNLNYIKAFFKLSYLFLNNKYDIIHCHHAFCVLLCIFQSRRIVYTVHEGELDHAKTSPLIKLAISLSNKVIYVNKSAYLGSKKTKKHFVPCGIDFDRFDSATLFDDSRYYILFPADPNRPEKNANLLKSISESLKKDFPGLDIIFGGNIPREDMPKVMLGAKIVITIGKFESDGLVLKEAMALNVPVISTDVGNAKFYLDDSSGLLCEETSDDLYKKIVMILNNHSDFRSGRQRLLNLGVSQRDTAAKILSIYNED